MPPSLRSGCRRPGIEVAPVCVLEGARLLLAPASPVAGRGSSPLGAREASPAVTGVSTHTVCQLCGGWGTGVCLSYGQNRGRHQHPSALPPPKFTCRQAFPAGGPGPPSWGLSQNCISAPELAQCQQTGAGHCEHRLVLCACPCGQGMMDRRCHKNGRGQQMARPPSERSVASRTATLRCTRLFIDGS